MHYFYNEDPVATSYLSNEESSHCIKVLRKRNGDNIEVINGKGRIYLCEIIDENFRKCKFRIISSRNTQRNKDYHIHIIIAPTKNHDRIEWFVEKSCELGIEQITFVITSRSERKKINLDRLEKKAVSAMKQSKNLYKAQINELQTFNQALASNSAYTQKFIAFVDEQNPINLFGAAKPKGDTVVMIGPEGDFTEDEVKLATDNGFQKVSLGKSVLRTETAGVLACHTIALING